MILKSLKKIFLTTFAIAVIFSLSAWMVPEPEEGMYPLSEIHLLALREAGLKIDPLQVYNPNGISLVDALVNVGGCTGSFISDDGLMITNHHCVFGALQAASSVENDYIENGFIARERSNEIEAKGMTCQIVDSYTDVSNQVLAAAASVSDPAEKVSAMNRVKRDLVKEAESKEKGIRCEVAEMFQGKTYILYKYKFIKDVRIVYVPPRSIGEFGGETDNWVWPRHTGDFSFLRAYVAKDGSPAAFSKDNVPYHPKKFLKVNPKGADEGDFVFILGYPGRTFRHKPSQFLEYQEKYQLPYITSLYDYQIETMEKMGESNHELAIRFASRIKGLANTTKNYKGKLKGLRELSLVEQKRNEEKELQAFINSNPELKGQYGGLFEETEKVYQEMYKYAKRDLWFGQIMRASTLLRLTDLLTDYAVEIKKPDNERKTAYTDKNLPDLKKNIAVIYGTFGREADKEILRRMISDALSLPKETRVEAVDELASGSGKDAAIDKFLKSAIDDNKLADQPYFMKLMEAANYDDIIKVNEPMSKFLLALRKQIKENDLRTRTAEGKLDELAGQLIEVKRLWKKQSFVPDANSTLRLTYGNVKGYSPADAVYYNPVTSLKGVIEKSYRGNEYKIPQKLRELYEKKDFGSFYSNKIQDLPVAILYNTDTSGGNSGSPIMNAYGELIGVNYDRTFEATINDYAWNENYSRSIGVDIRYVLWVTQKIGGADFILDELGIKH